jgi:hypothetical protein
MTNVTYRVVEHDGGWAYTLDGVFSETFATREQAMIAATRVAREQRIPDQTESIEYQTPDGRWVTERADGHDRPDAEVEG